MQRTHWEWSTLVCNINEGGRILWSKKDFYRLVLNMGRQYWLIQGIQEWADLNLILFQYEVLLYFGITDSQIESRFSLQRSWNDSCDLDLIYPNLWDIISVYGKTWNFRFEVNERERWDTLIVNCYQEIYLASFLRYNPRGDIDSQDRLSYCVG